MDPIPNYYAALGISVAATADDGKYLRLTLDAITAFGGRVSSVLTSCLLIGWSVVRKAYRQKVLETHPDKLGPDASEQEKQEAEDQFRRVSSTS